MARVASPSTLTALVFGEASSTGTIALGSIIENHKLDVTKTHLTLEHTGTERLAPTEDIIGQISQYSVSAIWDAT